MMLYRLPLLSLFCSSFALQTFLVANKTAATYQNYEDYGHATQSQSLSLLSYDQFTTLEHPLYPEHSVRIKKTDFCDETVSAYTGYIDIEARHLFFYFFESRSDPDKDDVIFWTNGGPGCSSSLGLFMELGPCRVLDSGGAKYHPESWNTNANIFFIDQPIGVGFSYAEYGETVSTSEEAAQDIATFVTIFFSNFDQFKGRAFHMSGESYGGRYLPLFASAVYDNNAKLVDAGETPINLTSVMIGNGITDSITTLLSYFDMQCTPASVPPILDIKACVYMKSTLQRCEKWMTGYIRQYLDDPNVRTLLGVDPSLTTNFTSCNPDVGDDFRATQDRLHPTKDYVAALLERGVKVLIYVGSYDWICNWVGNERWTLALEWSGQTEFATKELRDWYVDGKPAGKTRSAKGFSFATIHGAGHMVPYDKPKESLEMVQRWLRGDDF
ncbi:serine carboxypeptidase [Desarmillaria tabescens]|uniref:Carboxypeptidase n=1 Tax=Armillaria tabescens TaxID=1929756 RepID=A0AA39JT23_ARMTA|nr:serine carboxypeptidase [Desarmillaria tabescens]KAK0448417.1 serine carboxypeptidase [Desarmillaria tabescens]